MMPLGFFSESVWKQQRAPLHLIPECGKCGLYRDCQSPKMPVSGKGKKRILILAEAPGKHEDREGVQLIGNAGVKIEELLDRAGIRMRKDCWLDNAVICRPRTPLDKNRPPTPKEVECCRPHLSKTLTDLNPEIIIPIGKFALMSLIPLVWKTGEVKDMGRWVGWQIPCEKLNAWICPTWHPSYLCREENKTLDRLCLDHLIKAVDLEGRPWKEKPDWKSKVVRIMDHREAADQIDEMTRVALRSKEPLAFDYETTTLKPDSKEAEILCCSIANEDVSIAFPWVRRAIKACSRFIRSDVPKIASNMKFEERWTRAKLGHSVRKWHWDTMLASHWLDCRRGITGLKFQSFIHLGAEDYDSHLEQYRKSKGNGGNTVNRLKEVDMLDLLLYCGIDSLFEAMLARKQKGNL